MARGLIDELKPIVGPNLNRALEKLSLSGYERDPFFRNDGSGRFEDVAPLIGLDSALDGRSAASGDVDGDGDLDLVLRNFNNPRLLYLENVHPHPGNFLDVRLRGRPGNPTGIGATVRVESDGWVQAQSVSAGSGFLTQRPGDLHFGLGDRSRVERVAVTWPGGEEQVVEDPGLGWVEIGEPARARR